MDSTLFSPNISLLEKQMGHVLALQLPCTWLPSDDAKDTDVREGGRDAMANLR